MTIQKMIPLIFLFLSGCATALTTEGSKVKLMKNDPPSNCKEIGSVKGLTRGTGDMEVAKNEMRNEAAEKGANYVRYESAQEAVSASGTAFLCP